MNNFWTVRAGAVCALAGALLLVMMGVMGASAGEGLARLEQPADPQAYTRALRPHAEMLVRVIAIDNLFLIAYTGAFVGTAALVWRRARFFGALGLGFALLTALLDLTENAVTVHLARQALAGVVVPAGQVALLSVLAQVKYAGAGLGMVAFAIALLLASPGRRPLTLLVVALFLLFPAVNAYTVAHPGAALVLILWMLLSLLAGGALLWRAAQAVQSLPPSAGVTRVERA